MTDLADMDRKAKHNQLINEGYCILPKVAPPRLIEEIREVTDELIDALTPAEQERYRLQGSLIEVLKHSSMAELISLPSAIDALRSLGFAQPKFFSGYIISKPPREAPALYWHQDWFGWDEPISYTETPVQFFLMYYLIDTNRNNGCLRVIPRSHLVRHELHDVPAPDTEEVRRASDDHPVLQSHKDEVDVPVEAGDLVVGDARLLHSAHPNKSEQRRTVITLWFCPLYNAMPESIKAIYGKPKTKPMYWPDEAWRLIEPLLAHYEGNAQPLKSNRIPGPELM